MTDEEVVVLVGQRAKELAEDERVKSKMMEKYLDGASMEEIQKDVYMMAIATLYGMP